MCGAGVRERGERGIKVGPGTRIGGMQGEVERALRCRPARTRHWVGAFIYALAVVRW
jgi:hypothetical protein